MATRWAFSAATRVTRAAASRASGEFAKRQGATKGQQVLQNSLIKRSMGTEGKCGGALLQSETRALRMSLRQSRQFSSVATAARASSYLIRNFMVSDCLFLFDSEGKEGT